VLKGAPVLQDPLLSQIVHMSGAYETRLERAITLLKPCSIEEIERILSELTAFLGKDPTPGGRAFLSWEEVREMSSSGLIFFGSHTARHAILTTLTEEEAQAELKKSRDILVSHKVVDATFIPFSYPNGNFSGRLSEIVREAGYHLAVTTRYGWNHWEENPYTLRRIAIHQDMASTEALFAARIVNLF
ncbi:MAG: polysaccharide deacetylase family protein, partial [Candidatus Binatia bacterium]